MNHPQRSPLPLPSSFLPSSISILVYVFLQSSVGVVAALRRVASGSTTVERLRRKDVRPLLLLLNADVDSLPPSTGVGNLPSPLELLRAEVCNLFAALLDYESSHVGPSTADVLLQCVGGTTSASRPAPASVGNSGSATPVVVPQFVDDANVSSLVAFPSSAGQIMPLLDADSKNSFASMVLFGVLPKVHRCIRVVFNVFFFIHRHSFCLSSAHRLDRLHLLFVCWVKP